MLIVKIMGLNYPERYAVRRLVMAAHKDLQKHSPNLEMEVEEVADPGEIGKFARVLVLPTLMVNGTVVCSGRFPDREEVAAWLNEAAGPA